MNGALALLRLLLKREDRDEILGDLQEGFGRRVERSGKPAARRWLWRQVLTIPLKLRAIGLVEGLRRRSDGGVPEGGGPVEDLLRDMRFGVRGLLRRPVFSVTAVLTLAVGAGMTTTMFTLVESVVLRPLSGANARGLVYLELETEDGRMSTSPTPELLRLIRDHVSAFSRVEGYTLQRLTLSVDGEPLRTRGARASDGFFSFLGVNAEVGRLFLPGDGLGDASPVVVLSHTFWKERFGGSRQVLGRVIVIDGRSHVVVGVLPKDFQVDTPAEASFWTPEGAAGELFADGVPVEGALARFADGVTLARARDELDATVRHNPLTRMANRAWVAKIKTPSDLVDPQLKRAVVLLQAGAALVLLIACGNLANLLLAQGEGRAKEFALRASLGAGRGRLVRQLLAECAVLGVAGAAGGVLLAVWALDSLPLFLPPGFAGFSLHASGLLFAAGVSMAGVLLAGLAPALRGSRRNVGEIIKGSRDRRRRRALGGRQILVAGQVAMAFVLLFSAGLLSKSFTGLMSADVGFQPQDLLTLRVNLPEETYPDGEARLGFLHRLRQSLQTDLPDQVGSATVATGLVEGVAATLAPLAPEGGPAQNEDPVVLVTWGVAPDYFQVVGVPLLRGRGFLESDGADGEKVVIINDEVGRRFFGAEDPVGRVLEMRKERFRVVGVAGTVRLPAMASSAFGDLQLFFPLQQDVGDDLTVLARIRGDPAALVEHVKAAVRSADASLPFLAVSLAEDALAASLMEQRANTLLTVLFAVTALLLGAVGIYGVVAYAVGRQVREIGIRMALGATGGGEVTRVVTGGMWTVGLGLVAGAVGAAALGPTLSGFLHEVSVGDVQVSVMTALVVLGVALLATWLPARRAATAHPSRALRAD